MEYTGKIKKCISVLKDVTVMVIIQENQVREVNIHCDCEYLFLKNKKENAKKCWQQSVALKTICCP